MPRIDHSIIGELEQLGRDLNTNKTAADQPTSHPSGKAPSGDQPAQSGQFADENSGDSKRTTGNNGVESQPNNHPVSEDMHDKPNQGPLNPSQAEDSAPSEIDPKKTINSGDEDGSAKNPEDVTPETGHGQGEGQVGGVGGPKFDETSGNGSESAHSGDTTGAGNESGDKQDAPSNSGSKIGGDLTDRMDNWLKRASAFIPEPQDPNAGTSQNNAEQNNTGKQASETETDDSQYVSPEQAEMLKQAEANAQAEIQRVIKQAGVENGTREQKQAAIVRAVAQEGVKLANGFILGQDPETFSDVVNGRFDKLAADDPSGTMSASQAGGGSGRPTSCGRRRPAGRPGSS